MLRLSRLADYSLLILGRMNPPGGKVTTAPAMAAITGLPGPTVAKVLKRLTRAGLVRSRRGSGGGYRLARPVQAISVADVVAALDGPVALTACVEEAGPGCSVSALCPMHGRWTPVNQAVRAALEAVTLADMLTTAPEGAPEREAAPVKADQNTLADARPLVTAR